LVSTVIILNKMKTKKQPKAREVALGKGKREETRESIQGSSHVEESAL